MKETVLLYRLRSIETTKHTGVLRTLKMKIFLILVVCLATFAKGDITGTNPAVGSCLCFSEDVVNIRDSACGTVIGSANSGQCYKYTGGKVGCTLDQYYEFFSFDWGGTTGWSAGTYIDQASDSSCNAAANEYTCQVDHQGQRVHESSSATPYDCVDGGCGNSCQGGQCVAYVTCSCTRNGNWAPNTACWSPGQSVMTSDGRCNRNIAANTAIATFDSNGNYYAGHAAVFISCQDDYTILAYDQWCCRSIGYSTYPSSHSYFSDFATITNPSCADRTSWPCRFENAGSTCCSVSVPGCLQSEYWWKGVPDGE